ILIKTMPNENAETDNLGESTKLDYDAETKRGELAVKVICLGDSAVGKSNPAFVHYHNLCFL
ncbi:hypothetical protein Avbf_11839, partial [Armadillidium vulgare]